MLVGARRVHTERMPSRLPIVLTSFDLPPAELAAAALDGELYRVGNGFAPIDEIEQPNHRAGSLRAGLHHRLIAEQRSAAWVWGALIAPPAQHEFCTRMGARVGHASVLSRAVREVVIEPNEVTIVNCLPVTTPLRTVLDLLRFRSEFAGAEVEMIKSLMRLGNFGPGECHDELGRRRNLPNKKSATRRLVLFEHGVP